MDIKKIIVAGLLITSQVPALGFDASRSDSHAPIAVMGDHTHNKGEMMVSYRYMAMTMDGAQSGQTKKTTSEVLANYKMAPIDMSMNMHMLGIMFSPLEKLTLMGMLPYTSKSMSMKNKMNVSSKMESSGIGDMKLAGLYRLYNTNGHNLHLNTGVSIPLGSIDEKDGGSERLAYGMQLGSGTLDLNLGATYTKQIEGWSYGAQGMGVFRTSDNKHDYRLGNAYTGTAWLAKVVTDSISASLRSTLSIWKNIDGADTDLSTSMMTSPTKETTQGGKQLDMLLGLNYQPLSGFLRGHRVGLEWGTPIKHTLNGTQLTRDWNICLGWQYAI